MLSLMINVGTSSIKYKLFNSDKLVKSATIDSIGKKTLNHVQAWEQLYQGLGVDAANIEVVGHKLPVGTKKYNNLVKIDSAILTEIEKETELNPFCVMEPVKVARLAMAVMSKATHYAIFDDGFYNKLPELASIYPLPLELVEEGFKKRGSQGISHQYVMNCGQKELGMIRTQRIISLHLGDSCSVCAIKDGNCIDVSGGISALEGLMGISQPGDVDGAIVLSLVKQGKSVAEIEDILGKKSGFLGLCGLDDMRDILYLAGYKVDDENYVPAQNLPKDEASISRCRLAVEMFVYRIVRYVGAYVAVLGGVDSIAFTGAVGVGSAEIRSLILSKLDFVKDYEILVVRPDEEEQMRLMLGNHLQNAPQV